MHAFTSACMHANIIALLHTSRNLSCMRCILFYFVVFILFHLFYFILFIYFILFYFILFYFCCTCSAKAPTAVHSEWRRRSQSLLQQYHTKSVLLLAAAAYCMHFPAAAAAAAAVMHLWGLGRMQKAAAREHLSGLYCFHPADMLRCCCCYHRHRYPCCCFCCCSCCCFCCFCCYCFCCC